MMVVSKDKKEVECEFRHLSLAEYLSAIYIHTTGIPLSLSNARVPLSLYTFIPQIYTSKLKYNHTQDMPL